MRVIAHRGASADAPENTLEAFAQAITQGADGVELDAQVCGSGEVVVCHDEHLTRLAGLDWEVARTPYGTLREADVGTRLGHAPAKIPLLEEVLELLPRSMEVNVELKCDTVRDRGLARKVCELVRRRNDEGRVVLSSFNALCLWRAARAAPTLRRGYLIDPARPFWLHGKLLPPRLGNYSVHPHHGAVTPERVARWKAQGLEVATWTVNDEALARRLKAQGVRYCITDRPAKIRAALAAP
jgi:glycerophosphoryl diester phosphodiesterase